MKTNFSNNAPDHKVNLVHGAFKTKLKTLFISAIFMACALMLSNTSSAQKITPKALTDEALVKQLPGFSNGYAKINGVKLHYVSGGKGKTLVLFPGWPQNWWSYHKILPSLSKNYRVIVVEYRGMGGSDKPVGGYDKKSIAGDVKQLLAHIGVTKAYIAGHDIGAQVAFSVAANYPELTEKLIVMDVPHPDDTFASVLMIPALGTPTDKLDPARPYLWWFAFNQMSGLPEDLLAGRFAVAQKYIFHYLLLNDKSINAFDRAVYANAYNTRDAIRGGNGWYQAFAQDIKDYKSYEKLTMPVLGIGGPGYDWLRYTLPNKVNNPQVVKIDNSGHFIAEEQPEEVIKAIQAFLN